ncbi:ATP-binding protein [soil metagenome]
MIVHFFNKKNLIIFFLFFAGFINAQNNKPLLDSLEKISLSQKDSDLVKTYNELTWQYRLVSQEKAIEYGNKALEAAKKINFYKGIAQAYNDLGIIQYDKKNYSEAINLYKQSLDIRSKLNDQKGIAGLYNKIGIVYQVKGDYPSALKNQQEALAIYETLKSDIGISYSLNNIAVLNFNIGNIDEALKYNLLSADIKLKINDTYGLSGSYVNIANIFLRKKNIKDAFLYYLKALDYSRKLNDKEYLSANLNNLGAAYISINDYKSALKYIEESYQLRKELDDKDGMISSLINLGKINLILNKPDIAFQKLNEAQELSKLIDAKTALPYLYAELTNYYESKNDFKKALEYHKLQLIYNDSLVNEDLNSKITEMNTKYETEKKEKELVENKLELNNKQLELDEQKEQRKLLLISIFILLIVSYLLYTRYKLKQRALFDQEMLKQQSMRSKAIIEAEERERMRIAQELHDGIGQQLSAVKLNLSSLQSNLKPENDQQRLMMENALSLIDDSVREVRSVSHSMMPNALLKSGLALAVREFLNRISHTDKLKIELEINGLNERLESTMESILFRVLQEIVNNIIKHSQATVVNIQIIRHEEELTLMVEDNGVGFDISKLTNTGIGLTNIQSRINYLNGIVNFDSQLGKGTTVSIEIPIK